MAEPQRLADPAAGVVQQGEEEAVPQPGRRRRGSPAPRRPSGSAAASWAPSARSCGRGCGQPLLMWCRNGFHPAPPPPDRAASSVTRSPDVRRRGGHGSIERADRRQLPVDRRSVTIGAAPTAAPRPARPGPPVASAARRRTRRCPPAGPPANPGPGSQEHQLVLQVVRIRLDRVRGPSRSRSDTPGIARPARPARRRPQDRPRSYPRAGTATGRTSIVSSLNCVMDKAGDNHG